MNWARNDVVRHWFWRSWWANGLRRWRFHKVRRCNYFYSGQCGVAAVYLAIQAISESVCAYEHKTHNCQRINCFHGTQLLSYT